MLNEKDNLSRLLNIMAQLRDPETGCPWDLKQDFASIAPFTIEEAYEVADAIASGDKQAIKEECGDLLFQVVFYAQLAKEEGSFEFDDIANEICEKLIRRHPHVFDNKNTMSIDALNEQWETIKQTEKKQKGRANRQTVFDSIPSGLPSLTLAYKLQKACAKVGFDWPDAAPVLDKVKEEITEIEEAVELGNAAHIEEEIGDALFALVNLARHHNVKPDQALRNASNKFRQRFEHIESELAKSDRPLEQYSLDELEDAWQRAKKHMNSHKKTP